MKRAASDLAGLVLATAVSTIVLFAAIGTAQTPAPPTTTSAPSPEDQRSAATSGPLPTAAGPDGTAGTSGVRTPEPTSTGHGAVRTPEPTEGLVPPITARHGILAYATISHGSGYLAIPEGPGIRVTICAKRCVTLVSTDAGPDKALQRAGRIGDLAYGHFAYICECKPQVVGLITATITYEGHGDATGPGVTPPATDG